MSTLIKLTKIEEYVRRSYQKLIDTTGSLKIDTLDNLEIYTKGILCQIFAYPSIVRLSPNEVSKLVATYPAINLQFPQNTSLRNAYSLPSTTTTTMVSSSISNPSCNVFINNLDIIALGAATTFATSSNITGLNFSSLKYIFGNQNFTMSSSSISNLNLPNLELIEGTLLLPPNSSGTYQTTLDFPKLLVGKITNSVSALQRINLPEVIQLTYTDAVVAGLQKLDLPKVKVLTLLLTSSKNFLTDIYLPSIEWFPVGLTLPTSATSLVNFYMGESLKGVAGNFITTSNILSQASVDNILIRLASLNGVGNLTSTYFGRTVTITGGSATPSAAGLAAKAILVARACTVTTN